MRMLLSNTEIYRVDTEEEAKNLPLDRHYAMKIKWCNEGRGCLNDK